MMFLFLLPLLVGFAFTSASSFTTFYSTWLGNRNGRLACIILRDIVGIPVWAIGYAMAVSSNDQALFSPTLFSSVFAWLLILAGALVILAGALSLRLRAVAPSVTDSLVEHGLYAFIRHPLYTGMLLELIGLFIWVPTIQILVASSIGVVWVVIQARLEELDLIQRIPAYKDYMQRVPRFLPRFR